MGGQHHSLRKSPCQGQLRGPLPTSSGPSPSLQRRQIQSPPCSRRQIWPPPSHDNKPQWREGGATFVAEMRGSDRLDRWLDYHRSVGFLKDYPVEALACLDGMRAAMEWVHT
uniref:Uncharacterized protein n=1 Tax=Oryza glumipatula TaxID=40148 RepID=A0A0E0AHZ4_9ORYZ